MSIDLGLSRTFPGTGGADAPVVYVVDMVERPFDLEGMVSGRRCHIVTVPVANWNDSLTPWPAPNIYRELPGYGGEAASTLGELVAKAMPTLERQAGLTPTCRAICGYSLGGLFALYALTHTEAFRACACLSGSVWYEGWVEHLRGLDFDGAGCFAFLSIGTKEKRAGPKPLQSVQDNMEACATILRERGCAVEYAVGPGNHFAFVRERFEAGLTALDEALH